MGVVARYDNMVFSCEFSRKLGRYRDGWKIEFLNFFEGTDDMFIATYKPRFPQHQFQIYKHIKKPMLRELRDSVREVIKEPQVRDRLREYNLNKLLT